MQGSVRGNVKNNSSSETESTYVTLTALNIYILCVYIHMYEYVYTYISVYLQNVKLSHSRAVTKERRQTPRPSVPHSR